MTCVADWLWHAGRAEEPLGSVPREIRYLHEGVKVGLGSVFVDRVD
jgi:hypothetical protein